MTVRQSFWSRRKQAVEAEAKQDAEARRAAEDAEAQAAQEQKTDDALLEELGLPDPDTLQAGDDFSAFMAKSVPARLRSRALRKLWLSNPVLANLDDLVDYAEDFRSAGLKGDVVQTTYQVGKGLMKHVEELARGQDPNGQAGAETALQEAVPDTPEDAAEEVAEAETSPQDEMEEAGTAVAAPKRRMRFVVEANA